MVCMPYYVVAIRLKTNHKHLHVHVKHRSRDLLSCEMMVEKIAIGIPTVSETGLDLLPVVVEASNPFTSFNKKEISILATKRVQ